VLRVISLWQPWASLIISGNKAIETRGWAAPAGIIGKRIAIAATKALKGEQLAAVDEPYFKTMYERLGATPLRELPRGAILGTAELVACEPITPELVGRLTPQELIFGWFELGRFAWHLRDPRPFASPVPAKGYQGLWNWDPKSALADQAGRDQTPAP